STSGPRVPTRRSTRWEQRTRSEPALPVLTHRAPSDSLSRAFPTVSPLRIPHESEPTSDDGRPRCERLSLGPMREMITMFRNVRTVHLRGAGRLPSRREGSMLDHPYGPVRLVPIAHGLVFDTARLIGE